MNNKNIKDINTQVYSQKVELLLRLIPIVVEEGAYRAQLQHMQAAV